MCYKLQASGENAWLQARRLIYTSHHMNEHEANSTLSTIAVACDAYSKLYSMPLAVIQCNEIDILYY